MSLAIVEIPAERLGEYARVPSNFQVTSILQVELVDGGLGGLRLVEVRVDEPYLKDYDIDELPSDWPEQFDVSNWGFFLALDGATPAGGAAVAFDTRGVFMLEARRDLAVLWDIRVRPEYRGAGIPLFRRAAAWAGARGCRQLKAETQNVNVPACRFYRRMGCELGEIRRFGYAAVPHVAHEVMLNWYLALEGAENP
ncbi:MAG: GNAT family N-acetyltransferase [Anaerolineales bacterium]|nr:GNAT family N-acetyltransferase [Anaerolineales bacterium]